MKLQVDIWKGPSVHSDETDNPSIADIQAAIAPLEAGASLEVCLTQDDPYAYINISGGPDLYLVTGEMSDEKILQLTDPGSGDETVALVTGGQLGNYARHDLVTRDKATGVAIRFLQHGDYDPSLPWDIQIPPDDQ